MTENSLHHDEPILTVELFPQLSAELIALLKRLSRTDWYRSTACPQWTVKDTVAHLLGGNIGRLAAHRHKLTRPATGIANYDELFDLMGQLPRPDTAITNFDDLVELINHQNAEWIKAAAQFSPAQLIEYVDLTDRDLYQLFKTLPPNEPAAIAVAWAGDTQSPNWFDIAREYTEKWLHQQHIREAVKQPGLIARRWLFPVLDTFMRALPYTYRSREAPEGTVISFRVTGEAGGDWSLVRRNTVWVLFSGKTPDAVARVQLEPDLAWRLFTKGVSRQAAQSQIRIEGDWTLGAEILNVVSIMA
jgi:uncharacterized protein (TIGR03083 family)